MANLDPTIKLMENKSSSCMTSTADCVVQDLPELESQKDKYISKETFSWVCQLKKQSKSIGFGFLVVLYLLYFIALLTISSKLEKEDYWCEGDGFVIVVTVLGCLAIFYYKIYRIYLNKHVSKLTEPCFGKIRTIKNKKFTKPICYAIFIIAFIVYVVLDSKEDYSRLRSLLGVAVILCIGVIFSNNRRKINIEQVMWGIMLQLIFGLLILRWSVGNAIFQCIGKKVSTFLLFTNVGSEFVFSKILVSYNSYAFTMLPVILFFSMFVSIFYYYGILQWMIIKLGWILENTMGTTPCESMAVAANIFLGIVEAPLVIYPYLPLLTKSELHAVITGGYGTIAGSVLAAYISFGVAPAHLISASVMSAPAALALAKLFYPEDEESKTKLKNIKIMKGEEKNVLHAMLNGITVSLPLIATIIACVIAFFALSAFLNSVADWCCQLVNVDEGVCSFQKGLGYILIPFGWLMGVPWEDCYHVGYLLGTKIFVSEFPAYEQLGQWFSEGVISARTFAISTYALCGFSSLAAMGAVFGSLGALAPTRTADVASIVARALVAGNLACYLTACVAGALLHDPGHQNIAFNITTPM